MKYNIPKLRGIVCGMEHAGTTLLAQLLRQHPNLETGYEVGALMYNSLPDFWGDTGVWRQFNDPAHRYGLKQGWKLSDEGYADVKAHLSWSGFYGALAMHSPLVRNKDAYLIDKTPVYQADLDNLVHRFDTQVVVIIKDPVLLFDSWRQRHPHDASAFAGYYRHRHEETMRVVETSPEQVMVIRYEDLIVNRDVVMADVFKHLQVELVDLPLEIQSDFPEKVPSTISQDIGMRLQRVSEYAPAIRSLIPHLCYL